MPNTAGKKRTDVPIEVSMGGANIPAPYWPIFERILPEFIEGFVLKAQDYDDTYKYLGSKGQFSDMSRKFHKLKRAIWDDKPLVGEQPDEIIDDMLAHLLLLRLCLEEKI